MEHFNLITISMLIMSTFLRFLASISAPIVCTTPYPLMWTWAREIVTSQHLMLRGENTYKSYSTKYPLGFPCSYRSFLLKRFPKND